MDFIANCMQPAWYIKRRWRKWGKSRIPVRIWLPNKTCLFTLARLLIPPFPRLGSV